MNGSMTPQECAKICWDCRHVCQDTLINHCLPTGGEHMNPDHVKLMLDCIDICQISADLMTRSSAMHQATCAACADICTACAESCRKIDTPKMKKCAEMCEKCADSCRDMSQQRKAA